MDLDEIEKLAIRCDEYAIEHPMRPALGYERYLARALLAILPVIRAAATAREALGSPRSYIALYAMEIAIDDMRRKLEEMR